MIATVEIKMASHELLLKRAQMTGPLVLWFSESLGRFVPVRSINARLHIATLLRTSWLN